MRHVSLILSSALLALFLACGSEAQSQQRPASAPAQAQPPAEKIFEKDISETSKIDVPEIRAQIQELIENGNKKLDTIGAGISQEIDTIEKAEGIFQKAVSASSGVAERLAPNSKFNKNLDKLKELALKDAEEADHSPVPNIKAKADRFREQAKQFSDLQAETAAEYQAWLNTINTLNANKTEVIFEIKLKAYAQAAILSKNFIAQAKESRTALGPLLPQTKPQSRPQ